MKLYMFRAVLLSIIRSIFTVHSATVPVTVAARSKAWVFGRWPAEIVSSNPAGGMDVFLL